MLQGEEPSCRAQTGFIAFPSFPWGFLWWELAAPSWQQMLGQSHQCPRSPSEIGLGFRHVSLTPWPAEGPAGTAQIPPCPLLKKSCLRLFLELKLPPNTKRWEVCYSVCINGSKSPGFRSLCWKENLLTFRDKIFSQLLWICQSKYNSLVFKVLGRKSEWNLLRSE